MSALAVFIPAALLAIVIAIVFLAGWLFVWCLCRAADIGDREMERAFDRAFPREGERELLDITRRRPL